MKWLLRIVLFVLFLAVLIVGTIYIWGSTLPKDFEASRTIVLDAPVEEVWEEISNIHQSAYVLSPVQKAEFLENNALGLPVWREYYTETRYITLELLKLESMEEVVIGIVDEGQGFDGTWTITLEPVGEEQTELTLLEEGTIESPILRFITHYFFDLEMTLDQAVELLETRF